MNLRNRNEFTHPFLDVKTEKIVSDAKVWQSSVILPEGEIVINCNIKSHIFSENYVVNRNSFTGKFGMFLCDGIRIDYQLFIGPNAIFVNDIYPKLKQYPEKVSSVILKANSSIGVNSPIMEGVAIGANSIVGAGSVVLQNVPDKTIVAGNTVKVIKNINLP